MRTKVFFAAALVAAVSLPGLLSADTVVEEIVARVNNQIITRSAYQHEQQQLTDEAKQQDPTHADQIAAQGSRDVLRGLIDRELLLQKGKDLDISADTEMIKKLDEMRKQMKLESMDDLEKAAAAHCLIVTGLPKRLVKTIIIERWHNAPGQQPAAFGAPSPENT
jgi:peptidyl-prolyl cis-trans isomerase SurA